MVIIMWQPSGVVGNFQNIYSAMASHTTFSETLEILRHQTRCERVKEKEIATLNITCYFRMSEISEL